MIGEKHPREGESNWSMRYKRERRSRRTKKGTRDTGGGREGRSRERGRRGPRSEERVPVGRKGDRPCASGVGSSGTVGGTKRTAGDGRLDHGYAARWVKRPCAGRGQVEVGGRGARRIRLNGAQRTMTTTRRCVVAAGGRPRRTTE